MKKILIFTIILILSKVAISQNLLHNGDFEQCDISGGCPSFSSGTFEGKFSEVSNWGCFGHWPSAALGNPDIWYDQGVSANRYAGIYTHEGIYQDLGFTTAPTYFKLKFKMRGTEQGPSDDAINGRGLKFFGATVAPTPFSCDAFA